MNHNNRSSKTLDMAYISLFAVIIAISSWISIPATVPFTLQTLGVFVTLAVLGGKRGTLSVLVYILLGAVGIPVFSGFNGGLAYLFASTGGYIVGFFFLALTMWLFEVFLGKNPHVLLLSMLVGQVICYIFGSVWFVKLYSKNIESIGLWMALSLCVFPYIIPDLIKIALAIKISEYLKKNI